MRRLLDAGATVFAQRGYHAARVDDIVKVARTSHGTFYLYFANKEELLRALAVEVGDAMLGLADTLPPVGPDADGRRALRAWLERFTDLYEQHGPVIRALAEAEIGGSEFGGLGTDVLAGLARRLGDRLRATLPGDVDPRIAALALVSMIERLNYYMLTGQVDVARTALLDTLVTVAHAGLFGNGTERA
jgi:AcrR family transcriptional regulator